MSLILVGNRRRWILVDYSCMCAVWPTRVVGLQMILVYTFTRSILFCVVLALKCRY